MLQESNKPQVLRLHDLQERERIRFSGNFNIAISEILPSSTFRKIKSSLILTQILSALPDIYYTLITVNYCRRRLGEEYTYVAMYKEKHYEEQGVLLNKKVRILLFVLEIISRNLILPILSKIPQTDINSPKSKDFLSLDYLKYLFSKHLGGGQSFLRNVEWIVLMVYLLGWNSYFNQIETILGIRYVYTYKNDQVKAINYKIQGWLIFIALVVKTIRYLHNLYQTHEQQKQQVKRNEPPREKVLAKNNSNDKEKVLCRICYDELTNRSATRCGHVFCWACIVRTLQMAPECPVCRTACLPREVIQLRNY